MHVLQDPIVEWFRHALGVSSGDSTMILGGVFVAFVSDLLWRAKRFRVVIEYDSRE